jgi:hypothetical protein
MRAEGVGVLILKNYAVTNLAYIYSMESCSGLLRLTNTWSPVNFTEILTVPKLGGRAVFHRWLGPSHIWHGVRPGRFNIVSLNIVIVGASTRGVYWREYCSALILGVSVTSGKEAAMMTAGRGVILGTLFYGGLLAIFIFLLGQLLPIVYVFVWEGL